ncbi:MAG: FAD-linked oxidase C-terminal domain-containing protein [Halobacteriales archaeon]|nr:FAD-linked oxidase C-terminal domain-containing protein [Halobacteriales archaeon]
MAIDPVDTDVAGDPATDAAANYDYASDDVERPGLVDDLERRVDGDVRFDSYSRELYATDASAYEMTPIGVVFPTDTDDVVAVMRYCAEREIPVMPRGGGTSLAGQAVNEAVVLDFTRYLDDVLEIDPDDAIARAEVGVYLGDLNTELAPHGLKFAPDPAWGDKSALGGAIGNNSTGAHSLKYGKTDHYIESCTAVLADGSVTTFGEISLEDLEATADPDGTLEERIYAAVHDVIEHDADAVKERYPQLKRNVSGYNLDRLIEEAETGSVNLARLLAGSEGTLAIVTEATVSLEPVPETKAMALLTYDSLLDAMEDVAPILEHEPAAVEVLDDVLLDLARDTEEFGDVVGMLPVETNAVLLVEFYAESDADGKQKVADLLADRVGTVETEADPAADAADRTTTDRYAVEGMEAHDDAERQRFWKMRKSGLPILLGRTTDPKHIAFIEDTAIPPEHLPEFVADFQSILEANDTYASFYAHAGPGVLHIRPLINTKTIEGVERMESIADAATDLVVEYGGSVSGEHGDGRARTQWNRKLYGDDLWETFRELKTAFDPDWLLNPGQVCGDVDMTENLRFDPDYEFTTGFDPVLNWDNENGLQGMAELCHGCGGCRGPQDTTGGVMCPTFRASREEITSTRGRANMLRQAMSGDLPEEEVFEEEFMHEVLDLCIGCKGCAKDCPSEVDMAKLKAEVTHEYHQRHGASLRDRVFANFDALAGMASRIAPLANLAPKLPGARPVMEAVLGIAKERSLPSFHRRSFSDWFAGRGPQVPQAEADRQVLLFPDTYTNYNHPSTGKAAVRVLEAAGVHVQLPDGVTGSGRPPFSKGMLDIAHEQARQNVDALAPMVADGWDVVVIEPSDAVMFQSDYLDLLSGGDVETVAASTYGLCEYLDVHDLDPGYDGASESLVYHGHCHQTAIKKHDHAVNALRSAGYEVDQLDSGCCGMAGSFGYEAEHYSMSMAIGRILFEQIEASPGDIVVAPGASCRGQLEDGRGEEPPHPVEKLAEAL